MRALLFLTAAAVIICGCATHPPQTAYGNFVVSPDDGHSKKIAADAAKQIEALYPPARTRFNLQQATPDAFGIALVSNLRARGYALMELPSAPTSPSKDTRKDATNKGPGAPENITLAYVLDRPAELELYRVTLAIGEKSLSRFYQAKGTTVAPAGSWVRKE